MTGPLRGFLARHAHLNWALADQTMVSGVNFLTGILLARFLGIEEFGRFTLAWMAVLFASSLQHALVNSPMMSIGPKQAQRDAPAYYGAAFVQQAVFGALCFAALWGGAALAARWFPAWDIAALALPLAAAGAALQCQDFVRRYFFTRGRARAAFVNDAISYLGQIVVLAWLFAAGGLTPVSALWAFAATSAAAALAAMLTIGPVTFTMTALRTSVLRHWGFARWLAGAAAMQWVSANLLIIVAGGLIGASAAGALKAAQNLMGVLHILFFGLENVVPARAAHRYHHEGAAALRRYLGKVALLTGLPTLAVGVIAAAAPGFWLDLFFGAGFEAYGGVLRWYAAVYLVLALVRPLRAGLRAIENTKFIFFAQICSFALTVSLSTWLVSTYGIFGVMYGLFALNVITLAILAWGLRIALAGSER